MLYVQFFTFSIELDFEDFKTHDNLLSNVSSPVSNSNGNVIQESKGDDACFNVGKEVDCSSTDRLIEPQIGTLGL